MARKTLVTILDDIDGKEGATTLTFSVAGRNYEIDLHEKNQAKFDKALAPFIEAARRAGGSQTSKRVRSTPRADLSDIRSWAVENGHTVSPRGRIAASVIEAYDAAKGK